MFTQVKLPHVTTAIDWCNVSNFIASFCSVIMEADASSIMQRVAIKVRFLFLKMLCLKVKHSRGFSAHKIVKKLAADSVNFLKHLVSMR